MKLTQLFIAIKKIVPKDNYKKLHHFLYASLAFSIMDLISIAYLIPAILLILDKDKLVTYINTFDLNIEHINDTTLLIGVSLLVLLYLVKNILHTRFNVKLYDFLYSMSHNLSMSILEKYLKSDYITFQQQNKGNLIQKITRVTNDFSSSLLGSLIYLVSEFLILSIIIIFLMFFYFKLTLMILVLVGVFALYLYQMKKKEINLINETFKEAYSKSNAELLNILDGYIEIKSTGNHNSFLNKFKTHNKALNEVTSLLTSSSSNYSKYLELFLIIGIAGFILYNFLFPNSTENFVLISVLGALIIKIIPSLSKILNSITIINSHIYSVNTLMDINKIESESIVYNTFNDVLSFNEIDFNYSKKDTIFENLNFNIKRGEIIGIKGVTGSGKSTFLHIVAGILAPEKGEISVDGNVVEKNHFFQFISYVAQQPFLFNGTLLENITMRQSTNIDLDYINFILDNLELKNMIKKMPMGLNTIITHNSSKLSGGQKQRLALARALYNKPKLLILDESTNQQNEKLESKIYDFIKKTAKDKNTAVIIVSHNPSIYSLCDSVYTLENNNLIINSN